MNTLLKFSPANAKTRRLSKIKELKQFLTAKRKIYSLDLLSGHFCPFAHECLSKAIYVGGKAHIQDGPHTKFRCYSASQEAQYPNVYKLRKHNSDLLRKSKTPERMYVNLLESCPKNAGIIRIHSAGDFFNQADFDAWLEFARQNPHILCYAYTKSLPYWLNRRDEVARIDNFILTASYGGRKDDLIDKHNLRSVKVVFSEAEARKLKLPIDHDDSHAARPSLKNKSFALLIHGHQPAGSEASKALQKLGGLGGKGSYNRKS